jgi:hypothetical protein
VANRIPSITTWTRIEPQPRDATLARSLQAQVRDPLWMLARQWQIGEFAGDDAGSPVQATIGVETQPLTGYRPGLPGGTTAAFDPVLPLEVHVEREAVRFNLRGAIQLGLRFEHLLTAAGIASLQSVINAFRAAFPIASEDPNPALAGALGLRVRALAAGRVVDGEALYGSAVVAAAGGVPSPALPPEATDPGVAAVLTQFIAFRHDAFSEPIADASWQTPALDYAFGVESAATGAPVVLEADRFYGGHLDWHAFSTSDAKPSTSGPAPTYTTFNFLPLHVTFRGMPDARWWNFEDSVTDFGQLDTAHVDLPKLLVMEFALVFGGDWFFVPLPTPLGSLTRVTTVVVTDTFGERTLIRPVEALPVTTGDTPWSMFKIGGGNGSSVRSDFIVMAPVVGLTDDADALEDVIFLRDNMAALAWAIEQKLQGALDLAVDGYEQYLVRVSTDAPPPSGPAPAGSPPIAYTLEQVPPDNWIPLVPVQTPSGAMMFRRGTLDILTSHGIVPLVPHSVILEPGKPLFLTDHVLTQIGVEVSRYLRRTRWTDGSTCVWMARQSGPGRGPGWSGLRFDFLRDVSVVPGG